MLECTASFVPRDSAWRSDPFSVQIRRAPAWKFRTPSGRPRNCQDPEQPKAGSARSSGNRAASLGARSLISNTARRRFRQHSVAARARPTPSVLFWMGGRAHRGSEIDPGAVGKPFDAGRNEGAVFAHSTRARRPGSHSEKSPPTRQKWNEHGSARVPAAGPLPVTAHVGFVSHELPQRKIHCAFQSAPSAGLGLAEAHSDDTPVFGDLGNLTPAKHGNDGNLAHAAGEPAVREIRVRRPARCSRETPGRSDSSSERRERRVLRHFRQSSHSPAPHVRSPCNARQTTRSRGESGSPCSFLSPIREQRHSAKRRSLPRYLR